ncbi:choice-of-anchor J domain-containing protein [Flavobacterium myungsuense]|uniref:Choice-of-anchor J domain-containing protein n=1 Tax=Flavobacterium myungsuense TaxID=651823 RepID=A0ABW3IYB9_9FLAO
MKNVFIKTVLFVTLSFGLFTSCVEEDDFDIPEIKEAFLFENFTSSKTGSGATEVPIAIKDWGNFNVKGSRKWIGKTFDGNNFAEFSSFYTDAGVNDEVWLTSPAIDLSKTSSELLSFDTKARFYKGAALKVLISENYDGTQAGLATATWTELNPTLPTVQTDNFLSSGNIDVSMYNSTNVRIAFKYVGSKATVTTTFQIDNIKIIENL